eukprot:COSAG02_NODE_15911_length_1131_cov_0.959302_3_plen_44_part_01
MYNYPSKSLHAPPLGMRHALALSAWQSDVNLASLLLLAFAPLRG